jgi:hypothetical protein
MKINKADSRNYLFIDLLVDKNARPGIINISFKKNGKEVYNYRYIFISTSNCFLS